jgi:hypothetical protein
VCKHLLGGALAQRLCACVKGGADDGEVGVWGSSGSAAVGAAVGAAGGGVAGSAGACVCAGSD